jgi:hypothetical protein
MKSERMSDLIVYVVYGSLPIAARRSIIVTVFFHRMVQKRPID